MTTSKGTLCDAETKPIEVAGSRSYGIPNTSAELKKEDRRTEKLLEDIPEDEANEITRQGRSYEVPRLPGLPEIPTGDDLKIDFGPLSFMASGSDVEQKVHKRASNVLKLTQENEKLQAQLKAMAEQLEAMEQLRTQLAAKEQKIMKNSSS